MDIATARSRVFEQGTEGGSQLARGLGWASIGLGVAQLAAPRAVARLIGVETRGRAPLALRAVGLRELAVGLGILARPRRSWPVWARVAGDVIDLGLLGWAISARGTRRRRAAAAIATMLGVTALDVFTTRRQRQVAMSRPVVRTITINRAPEEVYEVFANFERFPELMDHLESVRMIDDRRSHWVTKSFGGEPALEWDAEIVEDFPGQRLAWRTLPGAHVPMLASLTFAEAPGRRGAEVILEIQLAAVGSDAYSALAKQFAGPQLEADLRRLKQILEVGEVVKSDSSIHRGPHPARPSGELDGVHGHQGGVS